MPYVRAVKTKSGATAVQVIWSSQRGSRSIEHIGPAHDEAELDALKAAARQKIAAGQLELDLGLQSAGPGGPLPVTASRTGHLLDALDRGSRVLGLDEAAGGDEVFRLLVAARVIEPVSKLDSLRVLEEAGTAAPSYATVKRRLPAYAKEDWRQRLSEACAAHARLGPASLVLYDVSTLYFETDQGDGFREPGFSKERRLEPQITIGLLTDRSGFPLMLSAFEGDKGETKTMLPVIREFMAAHALPDVTVVADAGMISDANMRAIEAGNLSFILGMKVPTCPTSRPAAAGAPGRRDPRRARVHPAVARGPKDNRATRSSTTSTAPTGPGARCTASTSRSRRPRRQSTARPRSSATGLSSSRERSKASTGNWKPRPAPWQASRGTGPTWPRPRTASRSPRTS